LKSTKERKTPMVLRTAPAPALHTTKNDLPEATRVKVTDLLNAALGHTIDLMLQAKQAHWNVKGPNFIALHALFDEVAEQVEKYVDILAERAVQLGGTAEGTIRLAAARSSFRDYPTGLTNGREHVEALANILAAYGKKTREGISRLEGLKDADSEDIFIQISRGIDKYLWMVEAHLDEGGGH
jgi:starvation-inducible DNA-binding protein